MRFQLYIILAFLFLGTGYVYSQDSKEDVEKQAQIFFQKEEFIEATPLYLRLLSLEPKNPNYNYKYGACLLYSSKKKKDAFKYLNYSIQRGNQVEDEAYYYLGVAYHLTFQFDNAIANYEKYQQLAGNKALKRTETARQIEMCRNGKALLNNINEMVILSKTKINQKDFFRIYDLRNIGGELLVTDEFQTKEDKKQGHIPLIHFPSNSNIIYYSSYGERGGQKDIYERKRLPDGSWSLPQKIQGNVNTPYDEDFPYMDPSRKFLYFSSKGHNSMGGYDIFRSPYDEETNLFGEPENIDFPISSPGNDYFYIVDSLYRYAYFASQRETESDQTMVYNVRVERFPIQIVILKGEFASTIDAKEKELSIQVKDNSGKVMGDFATNEKGEYLINLPKGGRYEFIMKVGNKGKSYSQFIDIPFLKEFRPLKQVILETIQDGEEIVMIQNKFDEEFENISEVIAEAMEKISTLNVNKEDFDLDSLDRLRESRKILEKIGLASLSDVELIDAIERKNRDLLIREKNNAELLDKTEVELIEIEHQIAEKLAEIEDLLDHAEKEANEKKKKVNLLLAQKKVGEIQQLQVKKEATEELKKYIEAQQIAEKELIKESKDILSKTKNLDKDDTNGLMKIVSEHQNFFKEELRKQTKYDAYTEFLEKLEKEVTDVRAQQIKLQDLQKKEKEVDKEIQALKDEIASASKRKKEKLEMDLARLENQKESLVSEQKYYEDKVHENEQRRIQRELISEIRNKEVKEKTPNAPIASAEETLEKQKNASYKLEEMANDMGLEIDSENLLEQLEEAISESQEITETSSEEPTFTIAELWEEINPNFLKEIAELEATSDDIDGKKEILQRKKQAVIAIGEAKSEAIQENAPQQKVDLLEEMGRTLTHEINNLDSKIITLEEELIAQLEKEKEKEREEEKEQEVTSKDTEQQTFTAEELWEEVDDSFLHEIAELEASSHDIDTKKEILQRKRTALISIGDLISDAIEEKAPQQKITTLENMESALEIEIEELEDEIYAMEDEIAERGKTNEEEGRNQVAEYSVSSVKEELIQQLSPKEKAQRDNLLKERTALENQSQNNAPAQQKKIEKINDQIAQQEIIAYGGVIEKQQEIIKEQEKYLSDSEKNMESLTSQVEQYKTEQLLWEADKEKDPQKQRDLLNQAAEAQQAVLAKNKARAEQEKKTELYEELFAEDNFQNIEVSNLEEDKNSLEEKRNQAGVEILKVEEEITSLEYALKNSKKKEAPIIQEQLKNLKEVKQELEDFHIEKEEQLAEIALQEQKDKNKGVPEKSISNTITYKEEVEIAQSEEYKDLLKDNHKLTELQYELKVKEEALSSHKNELKQITSLEGAEEEEYSISQKEQIKKSISKIDQTEGEIKNLRAEIEQQQKRIAEKLDHNPEQKSQIQNMIVRDVLPIAEMPSLPVMATGIVMHAGAENNYSDENPIPLDVEKPKGLFFRVQIGAFNRPVPNETFKEFSPVSGEHVRPGLIRYMAGYFGERATAEDARDKIRTLGYSDAFVVAYCDGERIPVYRAVELLNAGACVPSIQTSQELIVESSDGSSAYSSGEVSFAKEFDEFAYNKAPGAAEAEAAETKLGLYFTVQVGVYNRPVSAKQLFNVTPLVTKRLDNGQIRYSSGFFNSVEEAKPHQQEVIQKGISDAFITAYYQGQRISIHEARRLLEEKGVQILESESPTERRRNTIQNSAIPKEEIVEEKAPYLAGKKSKFVYVSKESYSSFPTQVLNRYNSEVELFYYDPIEERIYSLLQEEELAHISSDFEKREISHSIYTIKDKTAVDRDDALQDGEKGNLFLQIHIDLAAFNSGMVETIMHSPFYKSIHVKGNQLYVQYYALEEYDNESRLHQLAYQFQKMGAKDVVFTKGNLK